MSMRMKTVAASIERRAGTTILFVTAAAAAVAAIYVIRSGAHLTFFDERQYVQIADNLGRGRGYSLNGIAPTAYRPPTWPAFLGLIRILGGGVVWMRLANVTLLGLTVVLLYRLVAKVFRPIAGLLAAVLFACYPLSIYTATTLYPQTSVSLLVVLVFTVLTWKRTHGWRGRVLTGLVLGLLVLDDPAFLFLIVVLPVVSSRTVRTYLVHFLEVTGGAAVPVAAWTVRNYVHFKELFFISTNGGYNLLLGNSPHAGADTGVSASISIYVRHASTLHGEVAQNSYYEHAAIQWVSSHPGRAGVLYILKFFNFFNSANNLATRGTGSSFEQLVLTASYLILVFLLVLRLICWRRCGYNRYSSYLLVVYVLGALVSAVVVTRVRYRGPFELFLVTAIAPLATAFYDKESPSQSDQQCLAAGDSVQG